MTLSKSDADSNSDSLLKSTLLPILIQNLKRNGDTLILRYQYFFSLVKIPNYNMPIQYR